MDPDLEPNQVAIKLKFREEIEESGGEGEGSGCRTGGGGRRGGASSRPWGPGGSREGAWRFSEKSREKMLRGEEEERRWEVRN